MGAPLFGTAHDAKFWLTLDCCGLTTAAMTWFLVVFSEVIVTKALFERKPYGYAAQVALFNLVSCMALMSHSRAMLSDPGAVPKGAEPLERDAERAKAAAAAKAGFRTRAKGWCHRCGSYKPPRAHHDSVTGRCVVKLDHYCPWTNNAIGVRNHKFFLLFIFYVFLMCVYALGFFIFLFAEAITDQAEQSMDRRDSGQQHLRGPRRRHRRRHDEPDDIPAVNAANCAVAFFALLFGLFTACMLCDQWNVLTTNVAKIDRLKGDEDDLNIVSGVNEVFGGGRITNRGPWVHIDWLLPTLPRFPPSVHDDIMGYQTRSRSNHPLADLAEIPDDFEEHGDTTRLLDDHTRLVPQDSIDMENTGKDLSNTILEGSKRKRHGLGQHSMSNSDLIQPTCPVAVKPEQQVDPVVPVLPVDGATTGGMPPPSTASTSTSILGRLGFSDKDTRHTV